eukprot:scaffold4.g4781.t1
MEGLSGAAAVALAAAAEAAPAEVAPEAAAAAPLPADAPGPADAAQQPEPAFDSSRFALHSQGAEARVWVGPFLGRPTIVKERFRKRYRHPALDARLTPARLKAEVRSMLKARKLGVTTPVVYHVDHSLSLIYMERIEGHSVKTLLHAAPPLAPPATAALMAAIGRAVAAMHDGGLVHGDLTTSNLLVRGAGAASAAAAGEDGSAAGAAAAARGTDGAEASGGEGDVLAAQGGQQGQEQEQQQGQQQGQGAPPPELVVIDFGLSYNSIIPEDRAVDLYVLERAFTAAHAEAGAQLFDQARGPGGGGVLQAYRRASRFWSATLNRFAEHTAEMSSSKIELSSSAIDSPNATELVSSCDATPSVDSQPAAKGGAPAETDGAAAPTKTKAHDRKRVRYGITDVPPWYMCILLGFQAFLTMLGATVLIPTLLVPQMGGDTQDLANVICTCFFTAGINTLIQTLLGTRLPIVQGGSFAYISPVLAITAQIKGAYVFSSERERFLYTMQIVQGGVISSAIISLCLALFGIFLLLLMHLSPITIGVNISILGLSLYNSGWPAMGACIQLGLPVLVLIVLFGFYLNRVTIFRAPIFGLFPVVLGLGLTWVRRRPLSPTAAGQWGAPIMTWSATLTMLAAVIPAALESIGDYHGAALISGAPKPPADVVSRGLFAESLCCLVSGLWGTGSGSTAYAENVGAIAVTGVASRRVIQAGACVMLLISLIGKLGAIFASIPQALIGGLFVVMFSLISGVGESAVRWCIGFSNFHHVDLLSQRFIIGCGLYCGLSIPAYFTGYTKANGHPPINTSSTEINNILNSLFETPAAVSLVVCLLLDTTIAAAPGERGMEEWNDHSDASGRSWWHDPAKERIYGWPLGLTPRWRRLVDPWKQAAWDAAGRCGAALRRGWHGLCGPCRDCCRRRRGGSRRQEQIERQTTSTVPHSV